MRLASFEEDIKDKRDLYIKGCELNDALSCALVGEIYELGLAHMQQDRAKALRYYARSCDIGERSGSWSISDAASSSAQEMLDGCALFANMQNDRTKLKTLCEDKNNARACVLYADKLSSKDEARAFLVKAASLDSARGHYALSVGTYGDSAYTFGGQAAIFKRACAVGVDVDFTRSCADLGLAASESGSPIPQEEQVGYLQMACGHVFYDKRACAALPKKLCNNEEVCLEQERQEQEAQALAASIKKANKDSSETANSKASKFGIFADVFYGYGNIELENFREGEYEKQSSFGVKMGVEGYLGGDSFAVFASPYVGLSMASVYIQDGDEEKDSKSRVMWNAGSYAGVRFGSSFRLYGIFDYASAFSPSDSSSQSGVFYPINSIMSYGAGMSFSLNSLRVSLQYLSNDASYTPSARRSSGSWWGRDRGDDREQDSRAKGYTLMVTIGIVFRIF